VKLPKRAYDLARARSANRHTGRPSQASARSSGSRSRIWSQPRRCRSKPRG